MIYYNLLCLTIIYYNSCAASHRAQNLWFPDAFPILYIYIYIYQAACGKPVRRAVNLGKKNDPIFQLFTFSENALETATILGKVEKLVKKDRVFGNFDLAMI